MKQLFLKPQSIIKKIFAVSLGILFLARISSAQPIADSAKYISPSQDIISVYFSEPVILSDLVGWSINVGGTIHTQGPAPAGMVLGGITGNRVDVKLLFSFPKTNIEYSDVIAGVSVNYDGSGDLRQSAAPNTPVSAFSGLAAINDVLVTCSMLSSVQSIGTASSSGPCQAVNIQLYIEWNWLPVARNSIHFSDKMLARVLWRDQTDARISYDMAESSPGSGKYSVITDAFSYPEEDVCTFNPTVYPILSRPSTDPIQPTITCGGGVNQQDYVIPAYRLDNEQLDGILSIVPVLGSDPTLFCVGEDIPGFVFSDATTFNCNITVESDRPNEGQRWMSFIYGSHTTAGIPDVWIDVYGTPVFVTDGNGDPITGPFTVDPATGGAVVPYTTSSGFFEGEVFIVPEPCTAPIATTYPIHHIGNYATDEEDDIFGVTLQNWGPCNQWDPFFPANPILTYDELRLVPAPPPPVVPSPDECFGSVTPSITAIGTGGVIDWYDDPDQTSNVHTGATYIHGENAVGVYNWWLTETKITTGPVACTSDTARSTLSIYPLPNKPDINISGPTDFCFDGGLTDVTLIADPLSPPAVSSYQWYRNGTSIGGAISNSITLDAVAESGTYTVSTYGVAPTNCPGPLSDPQVINIYALASATNPPNRNICDANNVHNGNATFNVTVSGAPRSIRWQRSSNGGVSWVDITGGTTPNDGCTYANYTTNTLSITSADYPMNGYQYRVKLTTTAGGCETFSNAGTLTVRPTPDIDDQPDNTTICEFDNTTFQVLASIASGSISGYQWQYENADINGGNNPEGVYSGETTNTLVVTGPSRALNDDRHRAVVTSNLGCRTNSNNAMLYINPLADITTHPQPSEICESENTSFTVVTDGNPVVSGYQWQVSTNGGGTWNAPVGGVYSGQNSQTLNLTSVPSGADGNLYRVILTSPGGCDITSNSALLTINLEPEEKTISSAGNNICFNTSTFVQIENSQAGVAYSVYNAAGDILIGTVNGNGGGTVSVSTGNLTAASYTYYVIARNLTTTCERRNVDEVTINVNPQFTQAQLHDDQSICSGFNADFYVTLTGGTAPYTLTYSDGSSNFTIPNYNSNDLINTGALGSTTVYNVVSVTDAFGCPVENLGTAITITVGSLPTSAILSGGSEICVGTNTSLRVNIAGGAPPYTIVFDNALLGSPVTPTSITDFPLNGLPVSTENFSILSVTDVCGNSVPGVGISGNPQTVVVNALPDATATTNNDPTICNNTATNITLDADIVGTTFAWNVVDADAAGAANGSGNIGDDITQTLTNATNDPIFVIYEIVPTGPAPSSCPGAQVDRTVQIEPIPQAVITNNTAAVCHNGNVDVTISSPTNPTVPGDLTFDMVVSSTNDGALGGAASNDIIGGSFPRNINTVLSNSSNNVITVTYTVTPKLNGCANGPVKTTTIDVEPTPQAAISTTTPVVCESANVNVLITSPTVPSVPANLMFDLVVTSTNDAALGGTASVDLSNQAFPLVLNGTLTNSSNAPITVTFTATPQLSGCSDGSDVVETVIVEPTPQAAIVNGASVICNGSNVNLSITSPTTPSVAGDLTFDLVVTSTDDANLAGAASADLPAQSFPLTINGNLTNASNNDIVVTYTVTPMIAGCTAGPDQVTTVTLEPTPVAAIANTTPGICNGDNVALAITSPTVPSLPANLDFDLVVTSDNDAALGGTAAGDLSGQSFPLNISGTLTNSSNAPITVTYTVTPALSGCGTGSDASTTVVVEPTPQAAIVNGAATVCNGGSVDLDITSPTNPTVAGDLSFNMVVTSTDAGNLGGTAAGGLTGQSFPHSINGTLTNASNTAIVVTYTVTPLLNGCANGPNKVTTVTVEPTPQAALNNLDNVICSASNVNIQVTSPTVPSVAANLTFDLAVSSTNDAFMGGTAFAPLGDQAFPHTLNGTLINTSDDDIVVTFTVTPKLLGCAVGPDKLTTVTVEPTPRAVIVNNNTPVCNGAVVDLRITSPTVPSVPADLGFNLVVTSDNDAALGGTASGDLTGATFPRTLAGNLTNSSDDFITVTYTVTPTLNGCANGSNAVTTVIVEPTPKAAITTSTAVICNGANVNVPITSVTGPSVPANLVFDLAVTSTNDGAMGGTAWGNLGNQAFPMTINGTLTNSSNNDITVTFRATPKLSGCTSGTPVSVNVVVEPTPLVTITNTTPAICNTGLMNLTLNSPTAPSVAGDLTFDVDVTSTDDANLGGTASFDLNDVSVGHVINGNLTNTSNAPITVTYSVTPKLAGCASGTAVPTTVIVYPKPNVVATNNNPVFPTGNATDILLTGDVVGTLFGWRVLNPGSSGAFNDGGVAIGGSITQTLSNSGAAPITVTYRIGPAANGCLGDSVDVTVQVDPNVDVTLVNNAPFLCTGGLTDIDISSSVTGTTFDWVVLNAGATGATDGNGGPDTHTIQQALTNLTTTPVTVTYRVTPTGPLPTLIVGASKEVDVTVYPTPLGLITNHEPRICNGSATSIELDSDVAGTTFTWTVTDPTGGASGATGSAGESAIGAYISQNLSNAGILPITIRYNILPTGQGGVDCPGTIVPIDVIVDPTPVASITNTTPIICSDETTDITLGASVVGTTFTYVVTDPKGTGALGGSGLIGDKISQLLVNNTPSPVTITYAITPSGPGATTCPGATVFEDVTVNPLPITSAITGIDTVCEGTPNLVFSVVHTADSYYDWDVPLSLGSPTFGGDGLDSYAVIMMAGNPAAQVTDSIWVFETNQYGCTRDTIYHPMTVIPIPPQANITGDASVCALTTHGYSVPNNPGSTYQWFIPPGAGFASADPTIDTVDITFGMISGQVRVIETTAGGCVTAHIPLPLTVNQLPISTINADKIAACLGDLITFTAGPAGGLNYEFFVNGSSVQTGASNIFASNGILNGDQVTVNVTSLDGCERLSMPLAITIYDPPVVNLSSSDADNIICFGENVSFTGTSPSAVNYNFFLNGVSQQSGALNFWSTIGLVDGDQVHVEVLSGFGCWGGSDTITTLVNDLPVAELGSDKDICPNNSIDLAVNITVGLGPYDVTLDNGVPMISAYNSGDPIPVSPPFTTTYNLVSVTDANLCTSAILTPSSGNLSGSATITVFDTVQILTQPRDALVCEGIDTSFTVGAIGETVQYQWESTQDLSAGFTVIGGATSATWPVISPNAAIDSTWYRVRVYSITCLVETYSDTVQLVLKYDPALVGHPADQLICENDGTGFAVDAGLTFNPLYVWQVSYDNGSSWLSLGDTAVYNGSSSDSLAVISASSRFDGYRYKAIVTGECGTPIESNVALLSINERPEILEHPTDTTVCEGLPVSFGVDAGVTTSVNYAWQVDMGSGFVALGDTAGVYAGTASDELSLLNPVSRYNGYEYRVVVSGACPVPMTSNPALLLVLENPEIVAQPLDTVICENESPLFSVNAGVTSGATYAWEVSYDLGGSWLDLADTAIYTGTSSNTLRLTGVPSWNDGNLYHVIVSGLCSPPVPSVDVSMTVRERPEIISQPLDTVVCEGTPALFAVDAGVTTGVAYQWQVNMNDGNGFVDLGDTLGIYAGATAAALQVQLPESRFNGYQYRVKVTGDCTPPQVSNTATLVVQELPEVTLEPVPRIICEEQNAFFTMSSGVTTAPSYQWQVDMGSGFVDIGADTAVYSGTGTPNLFLTLVPSSYNGYIYHAVVSGVCTPTATTTDVLLTVHQNPEIITEPVNDTVCEGDPAMYTVDAGVTTGVTYQWQVNRVGLWQDVSDGADYAGTTTNQLTVNNPVSAYNGYLYRAVVGGTCNPPVNSAQVLLVVHERPEITSQPSDDAICEDGDTYFVLSPGITTNPVILWEYSTDGIAWNAAALLPEVSDDSNDTLFVSSIPSSYDGYFFQATVSGECSAPVTSNPAVMTVYQKPEIIVPPVDVTDCEQDTVMFFVDAGLTTNPIYQWEIWNGAAWTIPPPDIYSGVNSDTMYINGIHSGIDQLQIRLRLNGICSPGQISDTAILTVDERPEVTEQPEDVTICENDSATFGVSAGVTTAPVYEWEYNDGGGWQPATSGFFENEDSDTLRLFGAGGVPSTWTGTQFRAIISNGCGPNDTSNVVTLVVNDRPEILGQPGDAVTCEGIATSYSINEGVTTSASFLWQVHNGVSWMPVSGIQYAGQGTNTLSILNPTSGMNGYGYRVILSGACDPVLTSDSVSLTVLENPEIILQPGSAAICEGSDTTFVIDAGVTTNPVYEWFYNDNVNGWQAISADGIHTGFDSNTLALTGALFTMDNWMYRVNVMGDCGDTVTSQSASLVVYKLPEIVMEPGDTTTCEFMNVAFSVDVGSTDAPFLIWEEFNGTDWNVLSDGGNYIGVNTTSLKVYTVDSSMTGFRYRVRVLGECEPEALSREAVLTVESAPNIWLQPVDDLICEGDPTSFTMTATGTNISYFWQVDSGTGFGDITDTNGGVYSGWDSNTLDLTTADRSYNFNKYRVRVEGSCVPMAMSDLAILFVQTPAEIQVQPASDTICEFENAIFSVNATGEGLSYQWQESRDNGGSWNNLSDVGLYIGSLSPTLSIFSVDRGANGYMYRAEITGTCGLPVRSDEIVLTVETPPEILRQPEALTACENTPAGFGVDAQGTNIKYRWQVNEGSGFANIADTDGRFIGSDSDTLTLLSAQLGQAGFSFRVTISGNCNPPATTNPVILLVNANPTIDTPPVDAAICEDGTSVFGFDASGAELNYQWYVDKQDGANFVVLSDDSVHLGSNTDQIMLTNTPVDQDGWQYRLDVFNACTGTLSPPVNLTVWPNPDPDITPAVPGDFPFYPLICGGDVLTLDGSPTSGSGNFTLHQWSGAVGPLSAIDRQVVDFTTVVKGDYNLAYTVTDDRGCKGSDVVTIVNDRPDARFVSNAIPSCGYMEVDFTNTSSPDAVSYLWDFDDGITSGQKDITHGFDNVDITGQVAYYNISMVASSINGCKDTALSVVTIYPKVVADFTVDPDEGCHPLQLTLISQPGGSAYRWDFGDGSPAQDGSYIAYHLFENYGTTPDVNTVSLTTTSAYGCSDTKTLDVTVQPIPQPNFTAAPLVQTYPDATVDFTNTTKTGPWTYFWNFGDTVTTNEESPTHIYEVPGTFDVIFYVMNGECMDSSKTTIVINPRIPIAAFEEPVGGCNPVEIQFVNQSQWATAYLWDFGDGYVSTKENPTHSFYDMGTFTIRLQATGPGGTDYASWTIDVWETPNVAFNSAPDSVFVKDRPVRFYNLSAGATNYSWDFGDYYEDGEAAPGNFSNSVDTSHIYFTEGYKDVTLVGWNEHCSDSITLPAVKVIPKGQLEFPTVFRPDPSGPNGGYIDPSDPSVDPNYANSIFFPGVNKQVDEYHLYVYNRWGEQIFQSNDINIGWDGYLNGKLAAQGVYFWKVNVVYKNGAPATSRGDITLLHKKQQ